MPNERRSLFGGTSSGGAGTSGGGGFNQYEEERENDRAVDEIANRAAALKRITIDIQEEAEQQQALLDNMGNYMDKSRGMVGKVSSYFNKVLKENRHRRYMYYVVGLVIFFLVLYRWMFSRG
ncbi:Bet1-like SNARE protein [Chloropicon roscoffensis]|uniref:Bet1-like SNARE protein n=1 Tax=Chloropicon roscoffensis TaxID=1461544 RepID=A0AAX4PH29_9CHLO